MNETCTQQGCKAGAEAILDGWIRSQKLLDGGAEAWNLGSRSTDTVCGTSELCKKYNFSFWFFGPKCSGYERQKVLDARGWNRSLKFENRLHSLDTQKTYWRFHCSVTYVIEQWRSYHANFSFIVTQLTSQSNDNASQDESKWKFQWRKRRTILFSQNKSYDEPEWRCWPGSPL